MGVRDRVDDIVRPGDQGDARSGFREIHHRQTDDERGGGRELEVDDRLQTHPPDFL